jgi:tetratricopeptide (TPR) repeat protein/O-antigen/teichoic acid export membrane protein
MPRAEKAVGHKRNMRRQFVEDNFLATASTVVAGLLGFGLQAISSHALHPAAFGKAFAVYSFFYLVITRPSSAFGRLQTWQSSREESSGGTGEVAGSLLRQQTLWLLGVGGVIALVCLVAGTQLAGYLHVPFEDIATAAVSVPFTLALQPLLGVLQGEQRFIPWSLLSVLVNLSRLVLVVAFVYPLGGFGFQIGNTLAAIITFVVCLAVVRPEITKFKSGLFSWRPTLPFIVTGVFSTVTFGVFQGADVDLVEHFFAKVPAGQYAAVAAISSAVFFASGGVASAVFPMIAARHNNGRSTFRVMGGAFALCFVTGLVGTFALQLFGHIVLLDFAGPKFVPGTQYIGYYAFGMAMLGWLSILVNTQQSLNNYSLMWILVPVTVVRPILVILFHKTILTVVVVGDLTIGAFAIALTTMYVVHELSRLKSLPRARPPDEMPPGPLPILLPDRPRSPVLSSPGIGGSTRPDPPPPPVREERELVGAVHHATGTVDGPLTQTGGQTGTNQTIALVRERTGWLVRRPWITALTLAAVGLIVRHAWISTKPLSSGDWKWPTSGRILEWFPWPSLWNDALGLSGENRFEDAFRFPVYAVNGLIGALGGSWTVIEDVVYFIPFAVLLPVAGWLLARQILGRTKWALLAPVILLGNTYFLVESNGEIPLVLAEAIGCLALVAFIKTMRELSLRWALVTSLLLAACAAADIRPAYITVILIVGYVLILALAEPGWRLLRSRMFLSAVTGGTFLCTQAFWLLPIATYKGHPAFPTAAAPDFTIITLSHGLAGVMANWTGGEPAPFTQAPLDPMFMVLPLVAMLPLVWRRMRPEVLWLAISALVFAFLAKTNNPPLGGIYDWMFGHVPGFNLFRDGSKFLYPIAIAYAVLIPLALKSLLELAHRLRERLATVVRVSAVVVFVGILAISGSTIFVLESGQLGSTTSPVTEPSSLKEVTSFLAKSHHDGPLLWFGSPVYVTGGEGEQKDHTFTITSANHPLYDLTGVGATTVAQSQDVFQNFCPDLSEPYCYVSPTIFPYLVSLVGASYIVSPAGQDMGLLPSGVTEQWLREQLSSMFGAPKEMGDAASGTQLLVWTINDRQPAIGTYPAVALVDSGPWSLANVLPAIRAMGVPAAYEQSYDADDYPAAKPGLPDSVGVLPRVNNGCMATSASNVGIMAETSASTLRVKIGVETATLGLVARSSRLPGWGVFGPVPIPPGQVAINATPATTVLGPCVAWSGLAASTFGNHSQKAGPTSSASNGEQLDAPLSGPSGSWTELRRIYDPGWRLGNRVPTAVGDGIFNLYHPATPITPPKKLAFTFSTLKWEHRGLAIAVATVLIALVAIGFLYRRRSKLSREAPPVAVLESRLASSVGLIGVGFVGLTGLATAIEWFGVPSRFPLLAITGDPYNLDVLLGTVALGVLSLSLLVRLGAPLIDYLPERLVVRIPALQRHQRQTAAVAAGLLAVSLFTAGCLGSNSQSAATALQNAEQAGQISPFVEGATLIEARNQAEAENPQQCIKDYTTALKTYSGMAQAYAGRAQCYQSNGLNYPASIHDYTRALQLSPGNPLYLLGLAAGNLGIGDISAAIVEYQKAVSTPASTPTDALAAIDGLLATDANGAAQSSLQLALSRYPTDALIRVAESDVAVALGEEGPAGSYLSQAITLAATNPNPAELTTALSRLCNFQVLRHEYVQAVAICNRATVTSQGNSGAFDNLSLAEVALGNLNAAITDLTDSIGAFQDNVNPGAQPSGVDGFGLSYLLEEQGRLYLEDDEPQAALNDYHQAIHSLPPDSPDLAARLKGDIHAASQP